MRVIRSLKYEDDLLGSLKDPKEAAACLNAHLEDEGDDDGLFLMALRDVARAWGLSDIAGMGNPTLHTVQTILGSIGLKLTVEQGKKRAS